MGDLANMTDNDGRVNGPRLLRWLRNKAEMYGEAETTAREMSQPVLVAWNSGRRHLLEEMAEDLEAELAPPDHPGDDDEFTFLRLGDTGPCDGCGRLTARVSVQDNGRAWFACPDCAARHGDDAVDLDDPAFLGRPEQE